MSNILAQANTNSKTCEWIGGGERCGCNAVANRNYCEDHLWKIYAKGTAVRRRPRKDKRRADTMATIELLQELYTEMVATGEIDA